MRVFWIIVFLGGSLASLAQTNSANGAQKEAWLDSANLRLDLLRKNMTVSANPVDTSSHLLTKFKSVRGALDSLKVSPVKVASAKIDSAKSFGQDQVEKVEDKATEERDFVQSKIDSANQGLKNAINPVAEKLEQGVEDASKKINTLQGKANETVNKNLVSLDVSIELLKTLMRLRFDKMVHVYNPWSTTQTVRMIDI